MKIARCLFVCLALSLASIANADVLRTVVLSGDTAPGTGAEFRALGKPALNSKGLIAFAGSLTGSGVTNFNRGGIWSEEDESLTLVIRYGDKAPGIDGQFIRFSGPVFNDKGQTAFWGSFPFSTVGQLRFSGLWSEKSDALDVVVLGLSQASGAEEIFAAFGESNQLFFNNAGQSAFIGNLIKSPLHIQPHTLSRGIWSEGKGSLALVALEGNKAPDTSAIFSTLDSFVFNEAGQAAFSGALSHSEVHNTNSSNDRGIWSEGNGSLALIARTGSESPVMGADFSILNDPVLNDAGRIAFRGQIAGSGVSQSNDKGIWSDRDGSLGLVVRGGSNAPGTGANFFDFDSPVLNGDDKTAFLAILAGSEVNSSNNDGIWSEGSGTLSLVAREGSAAPGTEETFLRLNPPSLNGAGQVAFSSHLSGENVNDDNNFGIWAEDLSGGLRLIAREGDQLDVDDGPGVDSRTIDRLFFGLLDGSGNQDGRRSFFNDRGQLLFRATFTDGTSGIFVSNLVAIPEPGALVLLGAGSVGLLLGRRG